MLVEGVVALVAVMVAVVARVVVVRVAVATVSAPGQGLASVARSSIRWPLEWG